MSRRSRRLLCAILVLVLTPVLLMAWFMARVAIYADNRDEGMADAAVVLGAAAWFTRPSPVFEERIKHALDLYNEGRVRAIVFTGGVGRGDTRSEAEVARNYALRRGVPESAIHVETASRSTFGNLLNARTLLERNGLKRVLLVSDPLHMRRAMTMARDLGIDARPSPTPTTRFQSFSTQFELLLKETFDYARYKLGRHFLDFDEPTAAMATAGTP